MNSSSHAIIRNESTDTPAASPPVPTHHHAETASTRTIGYALVGLGHIAQVAVLPGFTQAKHTRLAALVSGDRKKLRELGKKYDVPATYTYAQFDACLADPAVEAVYIALPNDLHLEYVLRAAAAGKHILCEKPLGLNAGEGLRMIAAAEKHGVRLMTAYRLHFEMANLATVKLVQSGKLGEPRYFTSSFSYQVEDPDNIRLNLARGGGPLYDIGTYCINAARHLMGDEPVEVSALLARSDDPRFDEVEESAAVILRFPRGRLASFTVSFGAAPAARYEFVGTKGKVVLEPAYEYSEGLRQVVTIDEKSATKTFPHLDQFGGEIEAFSECVLAGTEPEPSGWEGLADGCVIDAIFESAATGRNVRLPRIARPGPTDVKRAKKKPAVREPALVDVTPPHN